MDENQHKQSVNPPSRKWAILAGVCVSPIFILFFYLGDPGRGLAAMVSAGMILAAARFSWDLKDKAWYWITIAVIVLLHVPLILLIPWPYVRWSYIQLTPIGFTDFALDYGIIRLVEKVIESNRKADVQPSVQ